MPSVTVIGKKLSLKCINQDCHRELLVEIMEKLEAELQDESFKSLNSTLKGMAICNLYEQIDKQYWKAVLNEKERVKIKLNPSEAVILLTAFVGQVVSLAGQALISDLDQRIKSINTLSTKH